MNLIHTTHANLPVTWNRAENTSINWTRNFIIYK